jgi:hypothetical protein
MRLIEQYEAKKRLRLQPPSKAKTSRRHSALRKST